MPLFQIFSNFGPRRRSFFASTGKRRKKTSGLRVKEYQSATKRHAWVDKTEEDWTFSDYVIEYRADKIVTTCNQSSTFTIFKHVVQTCHVLDTAVCFWRVFLTATRKQTMLLIIQPHGVRADDFKTGNVYWQLLDKKATCVKRESEWRKPCVINDDLMIPCGWTDLSQTGIFSTNQDRWFSRKSPVIKGKKL